MSAPVPRVGMQYLNRLLPSGWSNYFTPRKAGAYYGLGVRCPVCEARPPREIKYGGQRWRWLTVHMVEHRG